MSMRRVRAFVLMAIGSVLAGCYGHQPKSERSAPVPRPPLIAPMSGRYLISEAGRPRGACDFVVTSSAGEWRIRGERRDLEGPRVVSELVVDEASAEPLRFRIELELMGERRAILGTRTDDGYFRVRGFGLLAQLDRRVPYAPGTQIDLFGDPLFKTFALALLGRGLEPQRKVAVRTVFFALPELLPTVRLETYELRRVESGVRLVALELGEGAPPVALWVREDGLPTRVRVFGAQGPLEYRLELPP